MEITVLAIDLAKNIFQLHGVNQAGKALLKKKLRREQLLSFIANLKPCLIAMEACGGAHYWSREFIKLGHEVKLISPQFVKPFVKSNKNDSADAEAIAEAAVRPSMRFVSVKQLWQHDIQNLHRVRSRLVGARTALSNEIRGLLNEYGIVMPLGIPKLKSLLPTVLEAHSEQLAISTQRLFLRLLEELKKLENEIEGYDQEIKAVFAASETAKRIEKIEGIGILTATALVAAVGDPKIFKNGRQFAAWLGLVPKQHSSGGKNQLLGISKRGDGYLRCLLIHGARGALRAAHLKKDKRSRWAVEKQKTRGNNRAAVALANKTARIVWAVMAKGEEYRIAS